MLQFGLFNCFIIVFIYFRNRHFLAAVHFLSLCFPVVVHFLTSSLFVIEHFRCLLLGPSVLDKIYCTALGLYLTITTTSNGSKLFYPVAFSLWWEMNLECYSLDVPGNSFWDVCPHPLAFFKRSPSVCIDTSRTTSGPHWHSAAVMCSACIWKLKI